PKTAASCHGSLSGEQPDIEGQRARVANAALPGAKPVQCLLHAARHQVQARAHRECPCEERHQQAAVSDLLDLESVCEQRLDLLCRKVLMPYFYRCQGYVT